MKRLLFTFLFALIASTVFSLELYKSEATASFYGAELHGQRTSSGELFDMNDYTCAHVELPFDTILRVTNLANGKSVDVRVNDRGPFVPSREIDLSTAAALKLEMTKSGTIQVRIEIVKMGPNTPLSVATADKAKEIKAKKAAEAGEKSAAATNTPNASTVETSALVNVVPDKIWDIQLAAFKQKDNAIIYANKLMEHGFENIVFQSNGEVFRVVVSKVPSDDLEKVLDNLKSKGYTDYIVRERRRAD